MIYLSLVYSYVFRVFIYLLADVNLLEVLIILAFNSAYMFCLVFSYVCIVDISISLELIRFFNELIYSLNEFINSLNEFIYSLDLIN